jgi:hypothetical protein
MHREPPPSDRHAAHGAMNLTALLQMHMVARRAIRPLEPLCERYLDPVL